MQKNYVPDGWLGIILGAKIFINFSKYDFDECMRKLRMELLNVISNMTFNTAEDISSQSSQPVIIRQVSKEKITKIRNWKNDVNEFKPFKKYNSFYQNTFRSISRTLKIG